jgi:hypothetical protein
LRGVLAFCYATVVPAKTLKKTVNKKKFVNLPQAPSLWQSIGPSFILLGIALGSGELLLWPYLAAQYGLGLLWGALLGVTFQFFLNTEAMRYTLAKGESVFLGFRRLAPWIPLWFILSTFIPWSLPGFSSAASQIFAQVFPILPEKIFAIFLLLLTGVILTAGKTLYKTMETLQRTIIIVGVPFLAILTFLFASGADWQAAGAGLLGQGDGWMFFPPGVALAAFLGAFAYSGAGGNLNLAQSYYIKEKGFGMGKGSAKISSLVAGGTQSMKLDGELFSNTAENRARWREWWRLVTTEHFIVFWILGFVTIALLSVMAYALVFGQAEAEGIQFLYQESGVIGGRFGPLVGTIFLVIAGVMLFSTQLGVLESSSRIISENVLLLFYKPGKRFNLSLAFYIALWSQLLLGVVVLLAGIEEPRFLLTLSAVLNAVAMMIAFPMVYFLNRRQLPKWIQPGWLRQGWLIAAFVFFVIFVGVTVINIF